MLANHHNSTYTVAVDNLVQSISGSAGASSLYEQAKEYFDTASANKNKLDELTEGIEQLKSGQPLLTKKLVGTPEEQLKQLEKQRDMEWLVQQKQRRARLDGAINVCMELLQLSEGADYDETQHKSAKFLTTLVLFSPGHGKKLAELHQSLKPAYKAVLSLRVLDKLLISGLVKNQYMTQYYDENSRYDQPKYDEVGFTQGVIIPVMLAAMFQDVGLQHPDLVSLLEGEDGKQDRFRLLDKDERDDMLRLNYKHTIDYLQNGLGCMHTLDTVSEKKAAFNEAEDKRLRFQKGLVEDANTAKRGTSEIIKIPQIYASVIFSTKRDYSRKSLPTASLLIEQLAVKKVISSQIANAFIGIVGRFPLGYGLVYIPDDMRGHELDHYEYAIVSGLNPSKIDEPSCRLVTKNLMFLPHGTTQIIQRDKNLHFQIARKKLVKIDAKRLAEIMEKLTHHSKSKQSQDLVPYFWEPYEYFFIEGNQNLWGQAV